MTRFYALRILRDYIGHIILIGLPTVLIVVMISITKESVPQDGYQDMVIYLAFVYIIMFQGFGSAYTFEGIEHDFFTSFKQRLMVSPVSSVKFLYANVISSIITTFLQSLFLVVFVIAVYQVAINNIVPVIIVLFLGIIIAQSMATLLILLTKKAATAQAIMTIYIIISMMIGGFFLPFKETAFTTFLHHFSSPIAWVHYSVYGFINYEYNEAFIGIGLLLVFTIIFIGGAYHIVKKRIML